MKKSEDKMKIKVGDLVINQGHCSFDEIEQMSFPYIMVTETKDNVFVGLYFVKGVGYKEISMPYLCIKSVNYQDVTFISEDGEYEVED